MYKKILLVVLLLVNITLLNAQSLVIQHGNEDKSNGIVLNVPVTSFGLGLSTGFRQGVYKGATYNIDHNRYLAGLSMEIYDDIESTIYGGDAIFVFYGGLGIHDIDVNKNLFDIIRVDKLKKYSLELGINTNIINSNIMVGFFYDLTYQEGGFSIGYLLNRKKYKRYYCN